MPLQPPLQLDHRNEHQRPIRTTRVSGMTFRSNESTDIVSDSACVEVGEVKMKGNESADGVER